jgi:hypothetical protein
MDHLRRRSRDRIMDCNVVRVSNLVEEDREQTTAYDWFIDRI